PAMAIVREREHGNMELLIATPLDRSELMVAKVLPYAAIGLMQTTLILALGIWMFDVPLLGSLLHVYVAALLLIVANLALGLLISTRAQSQFQAMQMTIFVFLPSILISGFMFPFAGMPDPVQWVAEVLPMTHFLRLIRGIMLRGASLWELWPSVAALVGFTAVMMTAAILRFRKRLDWPDRQARTRPGAASGIELPHGRRGTAPGALRLPGLRQPCLGAPAAWPAGRKQRRRVRPGGRD